jgi:ActR/RegA family two-component response regulator
MTRGETDARPLAGAAVLLVHGDREVTERLIASLAARGAAVQCVEEVEQAIAAVTLGAVDAIVCSGDCSLDGHGWLEHVRMLSDRTKRGIPALAVADLRKDCTHVDASLPLSAHPDVVADRVAALLSRATMRLPRIP